MQQISLECVFILQFFFFDVLHLTPFSVIFLLDLSFVIAQTHKYRMNGLKCHILLKGCNVQDVVKIASNVKGMVAIQALMSMALEEQNITIILDQ